MRFQVAEMGGAPMPSPPKSPLPDQTKQKTNPSIKAQITTVTFHNPHIFLKYMRFSPNNALTERPQPYSLVFLYCTSLLHLNLNFISVIHTIEFNLTITI